MLLQKRDSRNRGRSRSVHKTFQKFDPERGLQIQPQNSSSFKGHCMPRRKMSTTSSVSLGNVFLRHHFAIFCDLLHDLRCKHFHINFRLLRALRNALLGDAGDTVRTEVNPAPISGGIKSPGACRLCARERRGACLWASRAARSRPWAPPGSEGHRWREEAKLPAGRQETFKSGSQMLTCPGSIRSVSHGKLRSKNK